MGTLPPNQQRRVNLYDFTWLDCINYSPDRNIGVQWNTIHKIYKWIHSEVTNTSTCYCLGHGELTWGEHCNWIWIMLMSQFFPKKLEYYTRRHNLSTLLVIQKILKISMYVFLYGSSSKMDHYWIVIKSGSSLDYHQVWIITGSSSSLDQH